ncbi:hypothetical protein D778_01580 [Xanthomarina gelatinilytica]|uniref:Uncharacterized protein n=1 Tax=Xanthomarina gelatinilytica TaxID=1137281 RepID=M7MLC2_9FLAO|nr:hypothetical protein D778_01580 [Xanthomarina gelatinilytica]
MKHIYAHKKGKHKGGQKSCYNTGFKSIDVSESVSRNQFILLNNGINAKGHDEAIKQS